MERKRVAIAGGRSGAGEILRTFLRELLLGKTSSDSTGHTVERNPRWYSNEHIRKTK